MYLLLIEKLKHKGLGIPDISDFPCIVTTSFELGLLLSEKELSSSWSWASDGFAVS